GLVTSLSVPSSDPLLFPSTVPFPLSPLSDPLLSSTVPFPLSPLSCWSLPSLSSLSPPLEPSPSSSSFCGRSSRPFNCNLNSGSCPSSRPGKPGTTYLNWAGKIVSTESNSYV